MAGTRLKEDTVVKDLSLQGALISLKHSPRLQSELQVTMETPGMNGMQQMHLRDMWSGSTKKKARRQSALSLLSRESFWTLLPRELGEPFRARPDRHPVYHKHVSSEELKYASPVVGQFPV